jgi:hypothetical protein
MSSWRVTRRRRGCLDAVDGCDRPRMVMTIHGVEAVGPSTSWSLDVHDSVGGLSRLIGARSRVLIPLIGR